MTSFRILIVLSAIAAGLVIPRTGSAQNAGDGPDSTEIALDPKIEKGRLANGLTYMIRQNDRPENRAELRLVVNAGSILESDDQLGLAHFVEHMAFNGTTNFPEQELVEYLESIGMRFGPDINAYTSFDETVYMLQLPTDSADVVETGFQILRDWAGNVAFDDEEIEKERGVVIEEWRLRRGGQARIQDRQLPVMLHESRYAERLPIGTEQSLEAFDPERMIAFYERLYRPDLMTVIAVGDFDGDQIESTIRRLFSDLSGDAEAPARPQYPVPNHDETLYSIESDREAPFANIGVMYKHERGEEGTRAAYVESLRRSLFASMLNQRLGELTQQADPPFIGAGAFDGSLVRTKAAFTLNANVRDGEYLRALRTMLEEAERVRRHGFTESEFDRVKTSRLRRMQVAYNERENEESGTLASEYIRHALTGESVPGIEREFALFSRALPQISLEQINGLVSRLMTPKNQVITVSGPGGDDEPLPSEAEVRSVFESVAAQELEPYEDEVSDAALLASPPAPGSIVDETYTESINLTEWTLSNGARVVLRPTDFKDEEILFNATSPGGVSLADDDEYMSATFSTNIVGGSGVGAFGPVELSKKLSGKVVQVRPYIARLEEGFSGSSSTEDLETLFQLTHLYGTAPRADSSVFRSFMTRVSSMLSTMRASPNSAFGDTLSVTLYQHHFRSRPLTREVLDEADLGELMDFYRERFADFGDFTFYFVGAFEVDQMRPLVEKYLASLPSSGRTESFRDNGRRTAPGVVRRQVYRGVEPKSRVSIVFSGEEAWSMQERRRLQMLQRVLDTRLRELLREDLGGTYGVSLRGRLQDDPYDHYQFTITFGCDPDRVDELVSNVWDNIESLKNDPPDPAHVANARESAFRSWQTGLKENGYWLNSLEFYLDRGMDPERILVNPADVLESISGEDISAAARKYLNRDRYVRVTLYPEESAEQDSR